jgi:hypothetical protein
MKFKKNYIIFIIFLLSVSILGLEFLPVTELPYIESETIDTDVSESFQIITKTREAIQLNGIAVTSVIVLD